METTSLELFIRMKLALIFLVFGLVQVNVAQKIFDLSQYGGVHGGVVDNKEALLKTWNAACQWNGQRPTILLIPKQTYLTSPTELRGPCKGPLTFLNRGVLRAPMDIEKKFSGIWMNFLYVNGLTIQGSGTFDGQGHFQGQTPRFFVLFGLGFVNNSIVQSVNFRHSPNAHLSLFACNNITISQVNITAPGLRHNTDGIKIGKTNGVRILKSNVASGDDCVAILEGTSDVNITNFFCSPGHGISIGGIGYAHEQPVSNIRVEKCHLRDTLTGLNIKTAATNYHGLVSNIFYEDVFLENTYNPIIINQDYCPLHDCPPGSSHVKVTNVQYKNIWGTSRTENAVTFNCSQSNPCNGIQLEDIKLKDMKGKTAKSFCRNVYGRASGVEIPQSCLNDHN